MSDLIVIKAKLRELTGSYNVSQDFVEALDAKVKTLVKDAISRAEGNGRRTVMAKDV